MKVSGTKSRVLTVSLLLLHTAVSACRHQEPADVKVTGGVEDYNILPTTVAWAFIHRNKVTLTWCSGAFVSDRLLLTAAHCIGEKQAVAIVSNVQPFKDQVIRGETLSVHPDFKSYTVKDSWVSDMGFLLFPPGTASPEMIVPIATTLPQAGDEVQMVGTGFNEVGKKTVEYKRHYGRNKILEIDSKRNDLIIIKGIHSTDGNPEDVNRVSVGEGDSGGPLYNSKNEIIGIVSNYTPNKVHTMNYFTNVNHPSNRKFIEDTIKSHSTATP